MPGPGVFSRIAIAAGFLLAAGSYACAQSIGAGTLKGLVVDASEAALSGGEVQLSNAVTGFRHEVRTAADGSFVIENIPLNTYLLRVALAGFQPYSQSVTVRSAVPSELTIRLTIAAQQANITVSQTDLQVETTPVASRTVDQLIMQTLPSLSPGSGLNDAITFTSPNVAADSNGFFHPLGDHAQVSFVVDGQPITDQRNKLFSTAIPDNAIQSMELISGAPPAEYGDKTSLVVNATTRSGLGQRPFGSFRSHYGSFGTVGEEATLGTGSARIGNFLVVNAERSGRFLDTPEFRPIHDVGNTATFFNRFDFQPDGRNALHLNLLGARNWMQVPNTYDQPGQDQRQKVVSFNIAPGYQRTFNSRSLLTVNAFVRRDEVDYYPSRNRFADLPATLAQSRQLAAYGVHTDLSRVAGRHTLKAGGNAQQTHLDEVFSLGLTSAAYNSPCQGPTGDPVADGALRSTLACSGAGFRINPGYLPGLLPYDLTRGGSPYGFSGKATISQVAWFVQDSYTRGPWTFNIGLRYDYYNGLTRGGGPQPRAAFSYLIRQTNTVIRGAYSHTLETPANENLAASSSTGYGGLASNLFGGSARQQPLGLGSRNQYDAGIQQSLSRWILLDVSYFRKYTRNAFDFDTLFSTPITFPIGWWQSKLDGVGARLSTPDMKGLRIFATMGHANARFFGPETGGIIFNSDLAAGAYRQDHDQIYQQNLNVFYQPVKNGWWGQFSWRYDSGLVVGAINNMADALALTAAQQSAIGLFCGAERASLSHRITSCALPDYGSERLNILAPGAENDDRNPPRAKPRNIFHLSFGTDNLFHRDRLRTVARFTILNLSNEASMYNFLSPFSGTHWFQSRAFQGQLGWTF